MEWVSKFSFNYKRTFAVNV